MDGVRQSAVYALLNTAFYAAIIYGNISFLYPVLYLRNRRFLYIITVVILLCATGAIRAVLSWYVYATFFSTRTEPFRSAIILNYIFAGLLLYILSFILRIALAYFEIKKQHDVILLQKTAAELNLLKSQVQPHFLFNTLNNIYYEAFLEAPRTAQLIERLAEIMRYFTDESQKDTVPLETEVQFLESYIELERIRIRHGVDIEFTKSYAAGLHIPPMLLITFIENIFKHGIDKAGFNVDLSIKLVQDSGYLHFSTRNPVHDHLSQHTGLGLSNLRQRLTLLYGNRYLLETTTDRDTYTAYLKIPLL